MKGLVWLVPIILAIGVVVAVWPVNPPYRTLDFLQIGNAASEATHKISGWGPIEPDIHGGNWGGLATDNDSLTDNKARVIWESNSGDSDFFSDRGAEFTMTIPKRCDKAICNRQWMRAEKLNIRYLDGIANDDFVILWQNPKTEIWELFDVVVTDHANTAEIWKIKTLELEDKIPIQYRGGGGRQLRFKFVATGNQWALFNTYGQVAIDYIWLEQPYGYN
jgi:hypothetical protein